MRLSSRLSTAATIGALLIAGTLTAFAFQALTPEPCPTNHPSVTLTVIATLTGFNNSRDHPNESWPVAHVSRCSLITLRLANQDTSQAHGLSVQSYANPGLVAGPGQTLEVTFLANRSGDYKIVCTIQCSVHGIMLSGLLQVT